MSIGKSVFALAVATVQTYALTSPNAPPPSNELRQPALVEKIGLKLIQLQRFFFWPLALAECALAFATSDLCPPALSQTIMHLLIRSDTPQCALTRVSSLTPTYLVGGTLILAGSLVRIYCYRALGRMFTFELSIRQGHRLVTSGLYARVRHPSYTGWTTMVLGLALCYLTPASFLVTCSGLFPAESEMGRTGVLVVVWVVGASVMGPVLVGRIDEEEAMLVGKFGDEWKEWVRRVPYRLVPGVY